MFIQIASKVLKSNQNASVAFVWIGGSLYSKSMIEIEYDIENLGLSQSVFFIGQVDFPEYYFEESNIFLLTSREDPFPLVMIEAAYHGLPIICFENSGGASEFVDSEIGSVVAYMDTENAANKVIELIKDSFLLKQKSLKSKEKARNFESEILGAEIFKVVEKVIY